MVFVCFDVGIALDIQKTSQNFLILMWVLYYTFIKSLSIFVHDVGIAIPTSKREKSISLWAVDVILAFCKKYKLSTMKKKNKEGIEEEK